MIRPGVWLLILLTLAGCGHAGYPRHEDYPPKKPFGHCGADPDCVAGGGHLKHSGQGRR